MTRSKIRGDDSRIRPAPWLVASFLVALACPVAVGGDRGHRSKATAARDVSPGRELFTRAWEPGERSPAGGDGVGPLYNETSCVACHYLGGIGGGGRHAQNVNLLTAVSNPTTSEREFHVFQGELDSLHEGFRNAASVVLHRHATDPSQQKRLEEIARYSGAITHDQDFGLRTSSRNTPAMFGAGLIDRIPDEVLLEAQGRKFDDFPEIRGRVSRLTDGRIGRFGWKGQTATLRDFVMAACANELGLEVPGHHQARLALPGPTDPSQDGLDMDQRQCDELVAFLEVLPPPRLQPIVPERIAPWGYSVFRRIGCASCHVPRLGPVNGLYSDLLLHDMGESLGDAATYYGGSTSPGGTGNLAEARERARETGGGAIATEWRTPPLWGVADSAPYLHDGRAGTLDSAINQHDGEARATARRYAKLPHEERAAVIKFLRSLTVSTASRKEAAIRAVQERARAGRTVAPGNRPAGVEIPGEGGQN